MIQTLFAFASDLVTWVANLGPLPMLLGSWLLASIGCPILVIFATLSALAGFPGVLAAFFGLYLATATIYSVARPLTGRLWPTQLAEPLAMPWLYVGVSLVPFWPFVVLCASKKVPLRRIYLAIATVSTPTLIIFSVASLIGEQLRLHPMLIALAAALLTILVSQLWQRRMRTQHGDLPVTTGLQRGRSTTQTSAPNSKD